jgi:hypothetical protein
MDKNAKRQVVAYYYPGWHRSHWKELDEWELLDQSRPMFDGHEPLWRPVRVRYDDRDPRVVSEQIREAASHGIDGFTYFLYFGPDGYMLDVPTRKALDVAEATGFGIGVTWCLRLPHQYFPIPLRDDQAPLGTPEALHDSKYTPTRVFLGNIVPIELLDTPVAAFVKLIRPELPFRHIRRGGLVVDGVTSLQGEFKDIDFDEHDEGQPSLRQIVDFLTRIQDACETNSPQTVSMDVLERQLALSGLLDISLYAVFVLVRELETITGDVMRGLSTDAIVEAFTGPDVHVKPADFRYFAALGRLCATELDVFTKIRLDQLREHLSPQALKAMSCRDARTILEGIAFDLSPMEQP